MNSNLSLGIPFQNWQCCVRRTACLLARLGGWVETSPTFAGANVRSLAVIYVGYDRHQPGPEVVARGEMKLQPTSVGSLYTKIIE
jgi:hypothetical protein